MMLKTNILLLFCFFGVVANAQYTVSGRVLDKNNFPVSYAEVSIPSVGLITTADDLGNFILKKVPSGLISFHVAYLGFATLDADVLVSRDTTNLIFNILTDNLTLKDVVVTAQKSKSLTTAYQLGRAALDHMQVLSVTDVSSLLPGGKTTTTQNLAATGASGQTFFVNGISGEMGNPSFGVGIDLDGVRLSNNAIPGGIASADMRNIGSTDVRNIGSTNIESVEIITGIPSVEYGDASNGIVKINTRKGKSPYIFEGMSQPNTKQFSLSKGMILGQKAGTLNFNIEHAKSVSNLTSPYTSYDRNGLSLNYSNTFNRKKGQPIMLDAGMAGNIGGYNSKSDPDMFVNTYTKLNDNAVRGNFSIKWAINQPWITMLEGAAAANYNNRQMETSANQSSSSSVAAIHTTEQGYHIGQTYQTNPNAAILLIPPGYWYEVAYDDSKLLNYSATLKATLYKKIGTVRNNLLAGGEYANSGNEGKGVYYQNPQYTPTWRAYPYNQIPHTRNYAVYLEDKITVPVLRQSRLQAVAGLRYDFTNIKGGEYGTVGSLSPRFNAVYTFFEKKQQTVKNLSVKAGWGKMVKLPSSGILFPQPNYSDWLTFAPGTTAGGETFYAYYTMPTKTLYNPALKWQYAVQKEIGISANIAGNNISVTASHEKTENAYVPSAVITPFTYKFTDQSALENIAIPAANRTYTVEPNTGVVTVLDKTNQLPPVVLPYKEMTRGIYNYKYINGSPVLRKRINLIIDFKEIRPLKTTFRLDGSYYYYKGVDLTVSAYLPSSTVMSDGSNYKYVGFYVGGGNVSNGSISKTLNMNLTATTHIPAIRLIFSARLEGSFINISKNISEYGNGSQRGFVLDDKGDYTASSTQTNIYGGNRFVGVYPEYYASLNDISNLIPFKETFLWAKNNNITLYNDLAKLVEKSNYNYYFNSNSLSFYYSANLSVTKEIGNAASLTFRAVNFINNLSKYHSSWTDTQASLYGTSMIPAFYYGLSLQLKL